MQCARRSSSTIRKFKAGGSLTIAREGRTLPLRLIRLPFPAVD
jgi:hypothetical protein